MEGSGGEPEEGEEELGAALDNLWIRGGKPLGVGDVLQGGGAGSTYFQVIDVGDNPPHGPGLWEGSAQGG